MKIEGIITALITPFNNEGEVNEGALKKLIEFKFKGGVNGPFLCGTAGLRHNEDGSTHPGLQGSGEAI